MVGWCVVKGCKQECYPGCGKTFHRFPTNNEHRNLWITAMKLGSKVARTAIICSLHFKHEDYISPARVRLKPGAVPSILPVIQNKVYSYENGKIVCTESPVIANDIACTVDETENEGSSSVCGDVEMTSEPTNKKEKQSETCIKTQESTKMRKKVKLRRYIRYLKEKIKKRDIEIDNLNTIINVLIEKKNIE